MRRVALVSGAVALSLSMVGCSGSGGEDAKDPPSGGSTSAGDTSGGAGRTPPAAFPGELPPGVSGAPLWSAQLNGQGAAAEPVGASVAVISPHGDGSTVEFRDAATGATRAKVEVTGETAVTTWHGRPALLAEHATRTPSDGISPEAYAWDIEVFDELGRRIAHRQYPGRDRPRIVDGRRVVVEHGSGGNPGALVVSDAGGDAPGWRIPCQDGVCLNDRATVAAGVVIHHSRQRIGNDDVETLAAFDPATGAALWTPQALARPGGVPANADAELVNQDSGKLVVSWYAGDSGTQQSYSVNDPATGRLLATGPTLPGSPKAGLSTADGAVVVVATTGTTAAWETGTGKLLWQQGKDENRLEPVAVVGPVLYSGKNPSMAVDLRTKTVIQRTVSDMPVPAGTGHAVVTRNPGVAYVFATQPG